MRCTTERTVNLRYFANHYYDGFQSKLMDMDNNKEIGSFEIMGKFDSGETVDMGIRIEDEKYTGKGYSRGLIRTLCKYILQEGYPSIRKEQLLFIDVDASVGFWDKVGMREHRYGLDYSGNRNVEGAGYEKMITFGDLCKWAEVYIE